MSRKSEVVGYMEVHKPVYPFYSRLKITVNVLWPIPHLFLFKILLMQFRIRMKAVMKYLSIMGLEKVKVQ